MTCPKCNTDHLENLQCPILGNHKVEYEILHPDWKIDVKVSNDNTKGEKRVTVHYRSDHESIEDCRKKAHEIYTEELGS